MLGEESALRNSERGARLDMANWVKVMQTLLCKAGRERMMGKVLWLATEYLQKVHGKGVLQRNDARVSNSFALKSTYLLIPFFP